MQMTESKSSLQKLVDKVIKESSSRGLEPPSNRTEKMAA